MLKNFVVILFSLTLLVSNINAKNVEEVSEAVSAFQLIDMIVEAEVSYGLSGAQLVVLKDGKTVKKESYGYTNSYKNIVRDGSVVLDEVEVVPVAERNRVTDETLFDLASNTKMYAGNYAIQRLITQGKITMDTKVVDIFPDFKYIGIGVDQQSLMNIGHLLRHDSGFIASPKYHNNNFLGNLGNDGHTENWLYTQDEDEILSKLLLTPIEYDLGTKVRYSDVDFMLLGKIVEEITGMPLDEYLDKEVYGPLGLKNVSFNPLNSGFDAKQTTSSELHGNTRDGREFFNNYRETIVTGEVHDEKAFHSFAGVSGHAGLFASAKDTAVLAQLMLDGGTLNNYEVFSQETIDEVVQPSDLNDTYAYGWRKQGKDQAYGWAFSNYASEATIGHTGWTGTLTQIDPEDNLVIVLFTNARNSPIMGPDKNDFWTKGFNTNDYGTITSLVYEGLGYNDNFNATDFVINKIESTEYKSPSHKNSVRALYKVLKDLAINDVSARDYILNNLEGALLNDDLTSETNHIDASFITNVDKSKLEATLGKFEKQPKLRTVEIDNQYELDENDLDNLRFAKLILEDDTATQTLVDSLEDKLSLILAEVDKPEETEKPEVEEPDKDNNEKDEDIDSDVEDNTEKEDTEIKEIDKDNKDEDTNVPVIVDKPKTPETGVENNIYPHITLLGISVFTIAKINRRRSKVQSK